MANVAHSSLTGSNLHENKGAASASDNTVATITTGATVWKKLTADNLTGTGNPFGSQLFHVQDQKTQGTAGGTNTAGSYIDRVLNTVLTNEITDASLSSNLLYLPAGTYYIEASVPMYGGIFGFRSALYNHTTSAYVVYGTTEYGANAVQTRSFIIGRFTLAAPSTLSVRYRATAEQPGTGLGQPSNSSPEIYTDVLIWKIS